MRALSDDELYDLDLKKVFQSGHNQLDLDGSIPKLL